MLFKFKNPVCTGTHVAKITGFSVMNEDDRDLERILINLTSDEGSIPTVSYSIKGYDMLVTMLASYGCKNLNDLIGLDVTVEISMNNEYRNAKILNKKAEKVQKTLEKDPFAKEER